MTSRLNGQVCVVRVVYISTEFSSYVDHTCTRCMSTGRGSSGGAGSFWTVSSCVLDPLISAHYR